MKASEYTKKATVQLEPEQAQELFHGKVHAREPDYARWGEPPQPELCIYDPEFTFGARTVSFAELCLQMQKLRTLKDPSTGKPIDVLAGFDVPEILVNIYPFGEARVLFGKASRPACEARGCIFSVCDPRQASEMLIVYCNDDQPEGTAKPITEVIAKTERPEAYDKRNESDYTKGTMFYASGDNSTGFLVMPLGWRLESWLDNSGRYRERKAHDLHSATRFLWRRYDYDARLEDKLWRRCFNLLPEQVQRVLSRGHAKDEELSWVKTEYRNCWQKCEVQCAGLPPRTRGFLVHNYPLSMWGYQLPLENLPLHWPDCGFATKTGDDALVQLLYGIPWTEDLPLEDYFQDPFELCDVPELASAIYPGLKAKFLFGKAERTCGQKYFTPTAPAEATHMLMGFAYVDEDDKAGFFQAYLKYAALYWQIDSYDASLLKDYRSWPQNPLHIMNHGYDNKVHLGVALLPLGWRVPFWQAKEDCERCAACYRELLQNYAPEAPDLTDFDLDTRLRKVAGAPDPWEAVGD